MTRPEIHVEQQRAPPYVRQPSLSSPLSPLFELELDRSSRASTNALSTLSIDRSFSEHLVKSLEARDGHPSNLDVLQQLLQLCICKSDFELQLSDQVYRLRAFHLSRGAIDIDAMARELLALGFMVQIRDGGSSAAAGGTNTNGNDAVPSGKAAGGGGGGGNGQHNGGGNGGGGGKDTRSCLQNLRHRFIVCLGYRMAADADPQYLANPLVVDPRFRDQFLIAHPTPGYDALLQAVPPSFVGNAARLEAMVKLLCEEMNCAFKAQKLPLPPWRTRQATMSKWAPAQLKQLAAKLAASQPVVPITSITTAPLPPLGPFTLSGGAGGVGFDAVSSTHQAPRSCSVPSRGSGAAAAMSPFAAATAQQLQEEQYRVADAVAILTSPPLSPPATGPAPDGGFPRKASAEFKQRAGAGKKVKSLLAAALRQAPLHLPKEEAAAARNRSIRTSGDEPWSRITTVRWGGAHLNKSPLPPAGPAAIRTQN